MASKFLIHQRAYGGKKFRPMPVCFQEENSNLFLCVTPWGREEINEIVVESIKNFLAMANEDTEVTVPFARKDNLNRAGNVLRMAIIMASERIFKEFNQEQYTAGFEIFAGIRQGAIWTYVCCGQPSLILERRRLGALPIYHNLDLNLRVARKMITDPLPNHILGLGQNPPIQYGTMTLHAKDQLILLSRSYIPPEFFAMPAGTRDLKSVSNILANDHPDVPFWLAFIEVN